MFYDQRSALSGYVSGLLSTGRAVFTADEAEQAAKRTMASAAPRAPRCDVENFTMSLVWMRSGGVRDIWVRTREPPVCFRGQAEHRLPST